MSLIKFSAGFLLCPCTTATITPSLLLISTALFLFQLISPWHFVTSFCVNKQCMPPAKRAISEGQGSPKSTFLLFLPADLQREAAGASTPLLCSFWFALLSLQPCFSRFRSLPTWPAPEPVDKPVQCGHWSCHPAANPQAEQTPLYVAITIFSRSCSIKTNVIFHALF